MSSLGDAAVLTGALAVGLRSAVDNVFANRRVRGYSLEDVAQRLMSASVA